MSLIQNSLLAILPPNRKTTPSGWGSFNAPCCHHRGDRRDDRRRGGIILSQDGFVYHCFNCGFKAGWSKGKLLSKNTKTLFTWLGMPESEVQKLSLEALKEQQGQPTIQKIINFDLKEVGDLEDMYSDEIDDINSKIKDPEFYMDDEESSVEGEKSGDSMSKEIDINELTDIINNSVKETLRKHFE